MLPRYTPDTTPEQRGLLRAVVEGVQVRQVTTGWYEASSVSRPGEWHTVRDLHCDCEAGQAGRFCKHISAVLLHHEQQMETVRTRHAQAMQDVEDLFGRD